VSTATEPRIRHNPYVGPRPFREPKYEDGRKLYGRNREARDVRVKLMAERILLLHAPSGAGKTSLLQARVIPELRDQYKFEVTPPLRVNAVPVNGVTPRNRYVWSVIVGFLGPKAAKSKKLAAMSLTDFIGSDHDPHQEARHRVIVLDQLEEILTLDPGDREKQVEFFEDLGNVLRSDRCWGLLSIREDFMGGLAPFAALVPSRLKIRYRIDFLGREAALEAVQCPADDQGVEFTDEAADLLVKDLAKVRRQLPGEQKATLIDGPYVEPVQLQAVCTELWDRLYEKWNDELETILPENVRQFNDPDAALGKYYENALARVAETTGASERIIRAWFEKELITEQGSMRNQTQTGPAVGRKREEVLRQLTDAYLIRSDQRGGTTWYELAHDRLIGPLCHNNDRWLEDHLHEFEIRALEWNRNDRSSRYLLVEPQLSQAKSWLKAADDTSDLVHDYIEASERKRKADQRRRREEAEQDDLAARLRGYSRATIALASLALLLLTLNIYQLVT
jgi:hypothetical protein